MQTASKKVINGWAMYDWANSVYNLVITSTIFPAYYEAITKSKDGNNEIAFLGRSYVNTALYNYALGVAFIVVAIMSPLLSSVADYKGNKKSFMNFFLTMGSIGCAMLFFFENKNNLAVGIGCMIVACIGFWGSLVFYNSFLPEIAAPQDRDRVSAKGFAMGYIGSVILQIVCFVFVFVPGLIGGNADTTIQYRICFLLVGIWWWGFGQFSLSRLPKSTPVGYQNQNNLLMNGYKELAKVWRQLIHLSVLKRFLFSFFFYNMGVQTVMLAATLYGTKELEIPTTNLIVSILIIQIIAIPGAIGTSALSQKWGNFKTLIVCVVAWILLCIGGYMLPTKGINEFYLLASLVGFVMGGIQTLSRSTYSKLMPETHDNTSFFSFYDVTEKIAIVIGMFSFGYITELTGSQRNSVLALIVFFVIGLVGLLLAQHRQNKILQ